MLEYHSNKEVAVANKVWDLGLKRFPGEVDFVIRHLQFLLSVNDDTSKSAIPNDSFPTATICRVVLMSFRRPSAV